MMGHRFFSSAPSRCFVPGLRLRPTAKNTFGVRDIAFLFPLLELDANPWTSCYPGGIRPTGPPPFPLGIDFFTRDHLHGCEQGILKMPHVKKGHRCGLGRREWART